MRDASNNSNADRKDSSSIEHTLSLIDGKFKCIILSHLIEKSYRFNELHAKIGSASQRTLAIQLRSLEEDGIIVREEYDSLLKRVEYSLTDAGRELIPLITMMRDWAITNIKVDQGPQK